jgi:hypothetical protein
MKRVLVGMALGPALAVALCCGCGGRASHVEWRVNAMRAEMRLLLPRAADKLACDTRRLETELVEEVATRRTYAVRGCGRLASYICETGVDRDSGMPGESHCIDARSHRKGP